MAEPTSQDQDKLVARLRELRAQKDLNLRPCSMLRDKIQLPDGRTVEFKLRPYQAQMVMHLLLMPRFLVGDDTGTGKTLEILTALGYLWEKTPEMKVLCVTTKSAVTQWVDEVHRFMAGVSTYRAAGTAKQRELAREQFLKQEGPAMLLYGYRSLVQDFTALQGWGGMAVVFDEATAFKNPQTRIHKVAEHLGQSASVVWALTATLIRNNLTEGYGVYRVVMPNLFPRAVSAFVAAYCQTVSVPIKRGRRVDKIVGHGQAQIERFRATIEPYYLGRAKMDVAPDLPLLTMQTRYVPLSMPEWQAYRNLLLGLLLLSGESPAPADQKKISKMEALLRCQQVVAHPGLIFGEEAAGAESSKLEVLTDMLTEGDLAEHRVIVYSRFRGFLVDYVEPRLRDLGVSVVRVTGSESEEARRSSQVAFRSGKARVILLTSAGSEALNLQEAQAMILADTPWSAGEYLQLVGRMIRIGSPNDRCLAIHLAAQAPEGVVGRKGTRPETIDEYTIRVMWAKLQLVEQVLGQRISGAAAPSPSATLDLSESEMAVLLEAMTQGALDLQEKRMP